MSIRQYALSMKRQYAKQSFITPYGSMIRFSVPYSPYGGIGLLEKMLDLHGTVCSRANMPFQPVPAAMG